MTLIRPAAACVRQQRCETPADGRAVDDGKRFFRVSAPRLLFAQTASTGFWRQRVAFICTSRRYVNLGSARKRATLMEASLLTTHCLRKLRRDQKRKIR